MRDPFQRGTLQFVCCCNCVEQQILLANGAVTAVTSFFLLQDTHGPLQGAPCIFPPVACSPDSSWLSWSMPISALFFLRSDPKPCTFFSSVGSLAASFSQPGFVWFCFVLTPGPTNRCGPGALRSLCYPLPAPSLQLYFQLSLALYFFFCLLPSAGQLCLIFVSDISSHAALTSPRWLITHGNSLDCGFHPAALQRAMAVSRDAEGQPILLASHVQSTSFKLITTQICGCPTTNYRFSMDKFKNVN